MRERYAIEDAEHPIYQRKPTMTAKHSPATSLPWPGLIPEPNFARQDAAYIVHAANAYPKLVEALRLIVNDAHTGHYSVSQDARALLRELGEAE